MQLKITYKGNKLTAWVCKGQPQTFNQPYIPDTIEDIDGEFDKKDLPEIEWELWNEVERQREIEEMI